MLRVGAEELAATLERHGRLRDYVCHPSTTHGWWMMFDHKRSGVFWGHGGGDGDGSGDDGPDGRCHRLRQRAFLGGLHEC